MSELKGARTVSTSQRYGEQLEETALYFDPESRSMSLGNTTRHEAEEQRLVALELLSQSILAYVRLNPGCTEADIVINVGGMSERIKRQLREMIKDGRLRREGAGRAGDPFRHYADISVEA